MWILFTIIYIILCCLFIKLNEIMRNTIMSIYILMVVYIYNNIYHINNLFLTILFYVFSINLTIIFVVLIYNNALSDNVSNNSDDSFKYTIFSIMHKNGQKRLEHIDSMLVRIESMENETNNEFKAMQQMSHNVLVIIESMKKETNNIIETNNEQYINNNIQNV